MQSDNPSNTAHHERNAHTPQTTTLTPCYPARYREGVTLVAGQAGTTQNPTNGRTPGNTQHLDHHLCVHNNAYHAVYNCVQ